MPSSKYYLVRMATSLLRPLLSFFLSSISFVNPRRVYLLGGEGKIEFVEARCKNPIKTRKL